MRKTAAMMQTRPISPREARCEHPGAMRGPYLMRVPEYQIRLRAYYKWEAAGRPAGDGVAFWLEAEQDLQHAT